MDDTRINALLDGKPLAVAGHPLNMLMAATYMPVDIQRYANTIINNALEFEKGSPGERDMLKHGTNAERARFGLWHGYNEYSLALDTFELMVKEGFMPHTKALNMLRLVIESPLIRGLKQVSSVSEERMSSAIKPLPFSIDEIITMCREQVKKAKFLLADT